MPSDTVNRGLHKEAGGDNLRASIDRMGDNWDILDVHTHPASDVVSGVLGVDRLGTGADGSGNNFLADDGTWKAVPGGGGTVDAVDVAFSATGNLASTDVQAALQELDTEKASSSHTHSAGDITSGTIAVAQLGTGSPGATNYLRGDGAWSGINGAHITAGQVPVARIATGTPTSSTFPDGSGAWRALAASDIASGTLGTARLGSGSATTNTFLRGDSTWAVPPGVVPTGGTATQALTKSSSTDFDMAWTDVLSPTSHDTTDHSTALGTAVMSDLGDFLVINSGPNTNDVPVYNSGIGWINLPIPQIASQAKCNTRRATGCAINSGTATLSRTGGDTFTSTAVDGGKTVIVPGAGAAGADLVTTIATVTNTSTAVLSTNASTTVSGKIVFWGTDDTTRIQAEITALSTNGGAIFLNGVALCNGELSAAGKRNVRLVGKGGMQGRSFTSTSGYNIGLPPSGLLYVKSGSTTFLTATQTQQFEMQNCAVMYANAGYTGKLIDLTGSSVDADLRTVRPMIADCMIGAAIDGLGGATLIDHTHVWSPTYRRVVTVGGAIQYLCTNGEFVVGAKYDECSVGLYTTVAVRNVSKGSCFTGGMVERNWDATVANRVANFIDSGDGTTDIDGGGCYGVYFSDVDDAAAASTTIALDPGTSGMGGFGLKDCRMGGGNNVTFVKIVADGYKGLSIVGGSAQFGGTLVDADSHIDVTGVVLSNSIAQDASLTLTANTAGAGTTIDT